MMLRLRLKTKGGGQFPLTERVSGDSTIEELRSAIFEVTAICPERQKILSGELSELEKEGNDVFPCKLIFCCGDNIIHA